MSIWPRKGTGASFTYTTSLSSQPQIPSGWVLAFAPLRKPFPMPSQELETCSAHHPITGCRKLVQYVAGTCVTAKAQVKDETSRSEQPEIQTQHRYE